MGKSTPKTPDYMSLAQQQGAENVETARQEGYLNNPNIYSEYGSQRVVFDPTTGQPTIWQDMSPEQRQLYDMTTATQRDALYYLSQYGPNAIRDALSTPFNVPGAPMTDFAAAYKPPVGFQYGIGEKPPVQDRLDFSGAPMMPVADKSVRDQVANSIYNQGARFLDERFANQQKALDTRLSNQGLFPGSEAFAGQQAGLNTARTQAYNDLVDRAVAGGGDAMAQLFGMGMGARQQGVGEITGQGQFLNAAQQQVVDQLLNEAGLRNSGVGAAFSTAGQNAALANAGRSQQVSEIAQGKILPINVMNSILSGTQVTPPPSQQYNPTSITPAPIFQGGVAQGQADINTYNARQGALNNWLQAGATLGGAAIKNSDRRLKSNIEYLGTLENGLNVYAYDIFGERAVGVMADEVEQVMPEAVSVDGAGYKMVDYAMLGLR